MKGYWLKRLRPYKHTLIYCGLAMILGFIVIGWILLQPKSDPLPDSIKKQLSFKVVYPMDYQADKNSWRYNSQAGNLTFNVHSGDGPSITVTEEKIPLAFQDDQSAYDRFIGGLRPFTNFKTGLGTVSLVNFVTAGDFQTTGPTGILKTRDTLVLAHPNEALTDGQWRDLFGSMTVD